MFKVTICDFGKMNINMTDKIVYYPTTDTISANNLSYISQQLISVLSIPMFVGTDSVNLYYIPARKLAG